MGSFLPIFYELDFNLKLHKSQQNTTRLGIFANIRQKSLVRNQALSAVP